MALVVQKEPFNCFLSTKKGFKAVLDFDDFVPMKGNQSLFATSIVNSMEGFSVGEVAYQSQCVIHISLVETLIIIRSQIKNYH